LFRIFYIYAGKKPEQAATQGILSSEAIVVELMKPYLQNGHTVFKDNWYTSPSLFLNLAGQNKCSRDSKNQPEKHATAVQGNKKVSRLAIKRSL
jgi:hypothetical protein